MNIQNKYKFNSHKVHNPDCDILESRIDNDTFITYGIYVKPAFHKHRNKDLPVGTEFCEVYTGENYNVGSKKRSNSRMYYADEIPAKYKSMWNDARSHYIRNLIEL